MLIDIDVIVQSWDVIRVCIEWINNHISYRIVPGSCGVKSSRETIKQTDNTTGCTTLDDDAETFTFDITTTPLKLDSITFAGNFLCDTEGDVFTAHGGKSQFDYLWSISGRRVYSNLY